ncbi:IS1 family transposase [Francisella tularensis]|nr:IS1 family transposase [Francisella tularensis]MBZ5732730.1 IS1 family transposase [Francisella tularensis]MBZ5742925.1 IS1 family transposase [Francisella tularensis]MBZ5744420.1 IS1 family transposase [Francisella tularensis]
MAKLFGVRRTTIQNCLEQESDLLKDPAIEDNISEIEFDEMWNFIGSKKCWIIKAYDRRVGKTIIWVTVGRDNATFRRLYKKVQHLTNYNFYTDDWAAFVEVLPKKRHIIGKSGTVAIEKDNSNTRHNLARMTRRTKVISRS